MKMIMIIITVIIRMTVNCKIMITNYHDSIEETAANILYCFNRIIAQAGHVLQVTDVKQALPINDIDA